MSDEHLSRQAIERYVSRRAPVDEILAAAEHLDHCFDCRDLAAAIVDDGSGEIPHVRHGVRSFVQRQAARPLGPWLIGLVVLAIVIALLVLLR